METLVELLAESKNSERPFISLYANGRNTGEFSYKDVYRQAFKKASIISKYSVEKAPILIEGNNDFEFLTNFFAVQMAGAVPVPVTSSLWITEEYYKSIMKSILAITKSPLALISHKSYQLLDKKSLQVIFPTDWEEEEEVLDFSIHYPTPDDTAFLQFSSGSTGNPKGVILSHKNVLANVSQITKAIHSEDQGNTCVSWLPVHHDMGLIGGFLVPFVNHYDCHIMSPYDFAVNPGRWLKVITEQKANIIVAPNSGYHLTYKRIKEQNLAKYDLSHVRIALCGAEPINLNTMKKFCEKFASAGFSSSAITPCYGMAENTLAISFAHKSELKIDYLDSQELFENGVAVPVYGKDINQSISYVSCGKPLHDIEVMIIDDKNYELEERCIGEIIVKSPSTCKGYYNREDLNKDLFIDGYLRTGDLGYIANGELYITGRKKDIIIQNGLNINAEEVELQLIENPHVRAGRLVALSTYNEKNDSEEIALIIETKSNLKYLQAPQRELMRASVHQTINRFVSVKPENIHIVPPGTILKTTSGKVKRNNMKQLLESGALGDENFSTQFFQYKLKENSLKANAVLKTVRTDVQRRISELFS